MRKSKSMMLFSSSFLALTIVACDVTPNSSSNTIHSIPTISVEAGVAPEASDTCEPTTTLEGWVPTWCEEFNYEGKPDPTVWNYQTGAGGWGNNEQQYYTNGANADVKDGYLTITAKKEIYNGANYTSTRMNTSGKADFKYGRFDIRAKLPRTGGTWPAIWMMPTRGVYGGWPASGEIDIMEHTGNNVNQFMGTIHTQAYYHKIGTQKGSGYKSYTLFDPNATTLVDDFHDYSIVWEPDSMSWLFDGQEYYRISTDELYKPSLKPFEAWPFDQDFHFILNIAMGGGMGGTIDPNFIQDSMVVDYIHVFEKDYVTDDTEKPSKVTNIEALASSITQSAATIRFDRATDDQAVKQYHVFVNGSKSGVVEDNIIQVKNLNPETTYQVTVIAQDYAGNLSEAATGSFETIGWPVENEIIPATNFFATTNKEMKFQPSVDLGGGNHLAYLSTNDVFRYKMKVTRAGQYKMQFRVAAASASGQIELSIGTKVVATLNVASTGGWQEWKTIETPAFYVEADINILVVKVKSAGYNLKWLKLVNA